jgi:hypothetical protein
MSDDSTRLMDNSMVARNRVVPGQRAVIGAAVKRYG